MAADGRSSTRRIGLIADTHGLLRSSAVAALNNSELILHAGDIGSAEVLDQLRRLAPVIAVRGNNDVDGWAQTLAESETLEFSGIRLHLLHDLKALSFDPRIQQIGVVISGHSHRPKIETRDGVLYINPGSAGPRRFQLPISVAHVSIDNGIVHSQLLTLE